MITKIIHRILQILPHDQLDDHVVLRITISKASLNKDQLMAQLLERYEDERIAYLKGWADCETYYLKNGDNRFFKDWYKNDHNTELETSGQDIS